MARRRGSTALFFVSLVIGLMSPAAGQTIENATPVAAFRAYLADGDAPTTVFLDGTPSADSDGTIVSYQWLFGDGTTGSGAQVEHTYPRIGEFDVSLVVIDDRGAPRMTSRTIDLAVLVQRGETSREDAEPRPRAPTPSSAPVGNAVGNRAPEFALPTLDGDVAKLSAYLGQVVVVDFWFQTCSGCVATIPHLEELEARYGAEGLVVIIVVLDRDPSDPKRFFSGDAYGGFVVVHEHDVERPTRTAYGVKGTPHVFLIDRSGVIRFSGKPNQLTAELAAKWL
jgi:thiol-disulfide isomerase/thioredoxin